MEARKAEKLSDSRLQIGESTDKSNALGSNQTQRISWKAIVFAAVLIPLNIYWIAVAENGVDRTAFHRCIAPTECHFHSFLAHRLQRSCPSNLPSTGVLTDGSIGNLHHLGYLQRSCRLR